MPNPAAVATLLLARCATLSVGSPTLPISYPEVAFTPPASGKYLRVSLFDNAPFWEGMTEGRIDQGLLQITLVWPKGEGVIKPKQAAAAVLAHFPKRLRLSGEGFSLKINKEPWAGSAIPDGPSCLIAVTIPWVVA